MKIEQRAWSKEAESGLGETLRDCGPLLKAQVQQGIAQLWNIGGHSWMMTRVETFPDRLPELMICCYQGQDLKTVAPIIVDSAKRQGMGSIRYHTQRPGLNRLLNDIGFHYLETIFYKDLSTDTHEV